MGGNYKFRALRLDAGNFSWPTEAVTRKTRVLDVTYNASNNELVRTQTLVKSAIVKLDARQAGRKLDSVLDEQFSTGRIYAKISSRPGQCGRCDGYILEGKELEFYMKKMQKKKSK